MGRADADATGAIPDGTILLAQAGLQNPAGFLDPSGASRAGTGNPPNAPLPPLGGSTLPPGAPASPREIETNPALRQEVRRPFGGGGYRGGGRGTDVDAENAPQDPAKAMNFSERQNTGHVEGYIDSSSTGRATGKLASDWRYVYFQRRHWYWMPNNTWDIWNGNSWIPHAQFLSAQNMTSYGPQMRGYRSGTRGYNSGVYGQPTTQSYRSDRLAPDRNDRYTGPNAADSQLKRTAGGLQPVAGMSAPQVRTPQPNGAQQQAAPGTRMLRDDEVIQNPDNDEANAEQVPDVSGVPIP